MFEAENQTIAAVCTGHGGALSILRISGEHALDVLKRIRFGRVEPSRETARQMLYGHLGSPDGEPCLAVFMPGPHSYTGEDVAEIQCHGGAFAAGRALKLALDAGARQAGNGEFTRRAFLNGKLDLTQAEGVMELISAGSEQAGLLAERQLNGCLGNRIRETRGRIIELLAECESRLDFSEEDLDWTEPEEFKQQIEAQREIVEQLAETSRAGSIIRDGVRLVIAGPPNAGKSSLMNRMLGYERAIVTEIPGTTRDTLEESVILQGIRYRLTDTAGLRAETSDPVEVLGIQRSREIMRTADLVVWLLDASSPETAQAQIEEMKHTIPDGAVLIPCWNKIDLKTNAEALPATMPKAEFISARTGDGFETLTARLASEVWHGKLESTPDYAVTERHAALLRQTAGHLADAEHETEIEAWELAGSALRSAAEQIGSITGETVTPDVLDEIFSRFCIGK